MSFCYCCKLLKEGDFMEVILKILDLNCKIYIVFIVISIIENYFKF
jgi:hypothetical protein